MVHEASNINISKGLSCKISVDDRYVTRLVAVLVLWSGYVEFAAR